jgi:flagellar biosynthesis protein FlhB
MSDNEQPSGEDKSHAPTPQKIRQSREKGDVPYSAEATSAATYVAFFVSLIVVAGWMATNTYSTLLPFFTKPEEISVLLFSPNNTETLGDLIARASIPAMAMLAILALAALCSAFAQQAFAFALSKIKPKLSRISMLSNAKQKYGTNGIAEFVKRLTKLSAILAIVLFAVKDRFLQLPALAGLPAKSILGFLHNEAIFFFGLITATAVVIAAVDMPWSYFQHRKRLMMTFQEVKKENKDIEGDPALKGARRQRAEAIAMNQMMADVPKADIIIVNPTHYATALKWDRERGATPICVAKGVDEIAARIRQIAAEHGVPIRRDAPTARSIFALVDIGKEIKREHYAAVAAAIHYADELRKKGRGEAQHET